MKILVRKSLLTVAFGAPVEETAGRSAEPSVPVLAGHYFIETKGRTDEEIVAHVERIQTYHAAKSERIRAFADLFGMAVGDFEINDVTIRERGFDVELYADAVGTDGKRAPGMPVRRVFGTLDQVPDNAGIVALVAEAIAERQATDTANAQTVERLTALLNGTGG